MIPPLAQFVFLILCLITLCVLAVLYVKATIELAVERDYGDAFMFAVMTVVCIAAAAGLAYLAQGMVKP